MKRAILVTAGTVAGLVSVLSYSPGSPLALSAGPGGPTGAGLNGPGDVPAAEPTPVDAALDQPVAARAQVVGHDRGVATRSAATQPHPRTSGSATTGPESSAAASSSAAARRGWSSPRPASSSPTKVAPSKHSSPPPHSSTPPPASTPPAGPTDYKGTAITYKYGTLQVAIRVQGGKIIDAWAVSYPTGESLPYSQMAIPILRTQTLQAQSAKISGASGATLTSESWMTSLGSALTKAGLHK